MPWPGGTLLERVFVLLDLGVSMSVPVWQRTERTERTDRSAAGPTTTWYVDLVQIATEPGKIIVRDLYADVVVPVDGRHQRFLDLHLHAEREPQAG